MPKSPKYKISTEKFDVIKLEEGIVENIVKESMVIDATDIQRIRECNLEIMGDKKYCVLITSHFLASITKDARELSASREFRHNTIAKALFVNNIGQKMVGNFYLQVNRPAIKTKMFTDREKALEWLREQLKENEGNLLI